jgi:acyl-coenzyme A thioesterase PaaI-like protein
VSHARSSERPDDSSAPPIEATDEHVALAAAARRLVAAVYEAGEVDEHLVGFTAELHDLSARIELAIAGSESHPPRRRLPLDRSPIAPDLEFDESDGGFGASTVFGPQFEGPPSLVHGGWIAHTFDEVLGRANAMGTFSGLTAELTVRYHHPTPLGARAEFHAHVDERRDRTTVVTGTLTVDGVLTCDARGVFVARRPDAT